MDELVKQVASRTGITEDQARSAVNTVMEFLKDRLPAPIAGQLDNFVSGGGDAAGGLGDIASKVGGIFGK